MSQVPPIQSNPNPYAYVHVNESQSDNRFEAMRKEYLTHEASTKSIGTLYLLAGVLLILAGILFGIGTISFALSQTTSSIKSLPTFVLMTLLFLGMGAIQIAVARGLWGLKTWARNTATVFAAIGLIGFPLGTLINGYFLYLLHSKKGEVVFSDEYKNVIAETPHIKYKTSVAVWVFLFLLVGFVVAAIVMGMLSSN